MKTEIRYVEALKNDSLEEQLNDKLQGLERKYDWIIDAQVFFKTETYSLKVAKSSEIYPFRLCYSFKLDICMKIQNCG